MTTIQLGEGSVGFIFDTDKSQIFSHEPSRTCLDERAPSCDPAWAHTVQRTQYYAQTVSRLTHEQGSSDDTDSQSGHRKRGKTPANSNSGSVKLHKDVHVASGEEEPPTWSAATEDRAEPWRGEELRHLC